jgi:Asp-tRNA(Asn)/Glu-tRNA(Gln) amidotransferase A subunit family amidase
MDLIAPKSLVEQATALRTGEEHPEKLAERACDRIDEVDHVVQALVPEPGRRERLREEAAAVTRKWPDPGDRPALYGVPVGVKDIVRVDGLPTRAGSALPPAALSGAQASVVDRLLAAGALVAGKTVTAEFAVSAPGPTHNPHNLAHTPGGSSSGSAAGLAAGLFSLAIGTQTVGSMIRPAAFCGVTGFKPTYGRIPIDGVIASSPSLDTLGLYASDVAGIALAAPVVCDGWTSGGRGSSRPVLGIPVGPYLERAGVEALDAYREQAERLGAAGFEVREVPLMADFEQVVAGLFVINRYEGVRVHAEWFPRYGELYREQTVDAIRQGEAIGDLEYASAVRERANFRERVAEVMDTQGVDVWIAPSAIGPAPLGLENTGDAIMCLPWSYAGFPVLGLPAGRAANGLPLGLQCVARPGADEQLLSWAPDVEAVFA